jgi:hypothetical protein
MERFFWSELETEWWPILQDQAKAKFCAIAPVFKHLNQAA